jgi:hypothetical protein
MVRFCFPESYATATVVSCTTAVGLGKMVENAKRLSPSTRSLLGKVRARHPSRLRRY